MHGLLERFRYQSTNYGRKRLTSITEGCPEILVAPPRRQPVIVETEFAPARTVEQEVTAPATGFRPCDLVLCGLICGGAQNGGHLDYEFS